MTPRNEENMEKVDEADEEGDQGKTMEEEKGNY